MLAATQFAGRVEFAATFAPRPGISHVLFDFDGTLSLIRQGWPEVMVPMFAEFIPARPGESEEARRTLAFEDIMRLNGKQTIYQMIQLAGRIRERGGVPDRARRPDPAVAGIEAVPQKAVEIDLEAVGGLAIIIEIMDMEDAPLVSQ